MFTGIEIISGKSSGFIGQASPDTETSVDRQFLFSSLLEGGEESRVQGVNDIPGFSPLLEDGEEGPVQDVNDISGPAINAGALPGIHGGLLMNAGHIQPSAKVQSGEFADYEGIVTIPADDHRMKSFCPDGLLDHLSVRGRDISASGDEVQLSLTDADSQSRLETADSIKTAIFDSIAGLKGGDNGEVAADLNGFGRSSLRGKSEERIGSDTGQEHRMKPEDIVKSGFDKSVFAITVNGEIIAKEEDGINSSPQESEPFRAGEAHDNVLGLERSQPLTADSQKTEDIKQAKEAAAPLRSFEMQEEMHTVTLTQNSSNTVKLSVEPEGLGKLDILLSLDQGIVNAQINADEKTGKVFIDNYLTGIVQALASDGLNVGEFSVSLRDRKEEGASGEPASYGGDTADEEGERQKGLTPRAEEGIISIFV